MNRNNKSNEAVVLTLRKRYSTVRRSKQGRRVSRAEYSQYGAQHGVEGDEGEGREGRGEGYSDGDSTLGNRNPWSDLRTNGGTTQQQDIDGGVSGEEGTRRVRNRLSFDDATRIIVLPEDAQWLMEDVNSSDSEDEYGNESTAPPSPDSTSNGAGVSGDGVGVGAGGSSGIGVGVGESTTPTPVPTPSKRHGTYFHHPERRRQTIPGAFPRS